MARDLATLAASWRARLAELDALASAHADDAKPIELAQTAVGRLSRMDSLQVQAMAEAAARMRALEKSKILAALTANTAPAPNAAKKSPGRTLRRTPPSRFASAARPEDRRTIQL